jgi:N-acetylmuramoyl-L-alanine amidase
MKVAISAGHNPTAKGASNGLFNEYTETLLLAADLIHKLQEAGIQAWIIGTGSLRKKVREVNDGGFDCAIEIHLNAGGGHGCETLYHIDSINGKSLATLVQKAMVKQTGLNSRGVKPGWYKMDEPGVVDYPGDKDGDEKVDFFLKATNCSAIIAEPFFIDGDSKLLGNPVMYNSITQGLFEGIKNWGKQISLI